jgi:hypothetical protein
MPSSKFTFPTNGATIASNQAFTISMAVSNFETGNFVNAAENYFAAPQQLNDQGQIKGHSHVVVELLTALDQTTPTDPNVFAFFKGLNAAAENGILTASVDKGLPAGVYKLSSINTAANHQPVLVPIAQHGSLDDVVYVGATIITYTHGANSPVSYQFTISDDPSAVSNSTSVDIAANATSTTTAAGDANTDTASVVAGAGDATTTSAADAGAADPTAAATTSAAAGSAASTATGTGSKGGQGSKGNQGGQGGQGGKGNQGGQGGRGGQGRGR